MKNKEKNQRDRLFFSLSHWFASYNCSFHHAVKCRF